jgi:hypothetical protein
MSDTKMKNSEREMIEFLLSTDYKPENNFTYQELLFFLNRYKEYYFYLHCDNKNIVSDMTRLEAENTMLTGRLNTCEEMVKNKELEINNLKQILLRKMTFWERIKGRIKL